MKRPSIAEQEAAWAEVIDQVQRLDEQKAERDSNADDEFDDQPTATRRPA